MRAAPCSMPTTTYRVTVNSFMASGGDNFLVLPSGTNRVVGAVDLDALVDYVGSLAAAVQRNDRGTDQETELRAPRS